MLTTLAPRRVLRSWGALQNLGEQIKPWGRKVYVLSGNNTQRHFQESITQALAGYTVTWATYGMECDEAAYIQRLPQVQASDVVVGVGGGKALDLAKWLAHSAQCPVVTIPTSAATCAAWAPLSNVYSPQGRWLYGIPLAQAPDLLVMDYDLLLHAPQRTLVAGIGDGLAKWYEASVSSAQVSDTFVVSAVQQARILRDLLLLKGVQAVAQPGSTVWQEVVDANIALAGLVGGLGGDRCRTVAAHAIHNALTTLPTTRQSLHGEKVAYGILVQLRLEEMAGNRLAEIARCQLLKFYGQIGLPTCLNDLHLGALSPADLQQVARVALQPESDLHLLPFEVTPEQIIAALIQVETEVEVLS